VLHVTTWSIAVPVAAGALWLGLPDGGGRQPSPALMQLRVGANRWILQRNSDLGAATRHQAAGSVSGSAERSSE
jgi:hypothetical protein